MSTYLEVSNSLWVVKKLDPRVKKLVVIGLFSRRWGAIRFRKLSKTEKLIPIFATKKL